jgi:hypothetical protein
LIQTRLKRKDMMRSSRAVPAAVLVAALLLSCSVAEAVNAKAADNDGEKAQSARAELICNWGQIQIYESSVHWCPLCTMICLCRGSLMPLASLALRIMCKQHIDLSPEQNSLTAC